MTAQQSTEDAIAGGRAVKRRGLIAAAAALVTGMMTTKLSAPVAANDGSWSLPYTGTSSASPAFSMTSSAFGGIAIRAQGGSGTPGVGTGGDGIVTTGGGASQAGGGGNGITAQAGYGEAVAHRDTAWLVRPPTRPSASASSASFPAGRHRTI